ncbi:MAG: acetyltransferase, amino-acid N-acetyltransferase [Deltaproteobacteria bacterium CSP1-8]|nr:MAG: acetyltransferase, amino-acid N-acetyltransferase [Deltaproteobacteria bacterium CSP1-8]
MIRKARMGDVKAIQKLIAEYARKGDMLPRSLSEIYENLRDYFVYIDDGGEVIGSAAIHIMWEDLAEVRSLAVRDGHMRKGVGTQLVEACISEAIVLGIARIFALTYKPEFFEKLGFVRVDKSELPQKIWTDCLKCSKFPDCDEVALVSDLSGTRRG